jgi:biopolymer transport protein ExbD
MGAKVGTAKAFDDMNLTPLIDVVLVVLIIMMVSIPIQVQEMGVKVPDPNAPPPPTPPEDVEQLVISIYEDGSVALNRRLMNPSKVGFELNRRLRGMSKKNVFIDAHTVTPYTKVVEMIDVARAEGAVQVGLAKLKPEGPLPYTSVDAGTIPRGVHIGSPIIGGMINEKKADEALAPFKAAIDGCWTQMLARNPDATGRLMLTAKYLPDGTLFEPPKISANDVEGGDPAFELCVLDAVKGIRSADLGEGNTGVATYPMIFSPG